VRRTTVQRGSCGDNGRPRLLGGLDEAKEFSSIYSIRTFNVVFNVPQVAGAKTTLLELTLYQH